MTYQEATVLSQTVALILFVALFVAVIVYVYWPGNKTKFKDAAELPLGDDSDDELDGGRK